MQLVPERLIGARNNADISQQNLADKLGKSLRTIQNWESGDNMPKNPAMLSKIAQHLNVSVKYLTGQNDSQTSYQEVQENVPNVGARVVMRNVPVVSWASCGRSNDYEDMEGQIDETLQCETKDPNAFALIVEGDSMESEIMAGDRVVFEPNSEPRNNDIVVARMLAGGVVVKRFRSKGPDNIVLVSNRSEYPLMELRRADLRFIYPAIEIIRRLRR
jgi:SOS-response transcriptional repressor LexA